jgi:hypothetical protein
MTTQEQLIQANDNASDFADANMEAYQNEFAQDIDYLMREEQGRDTELWEALGIGAALLSDYDGVERDDRDLDWSEGMGGLSAASTTQVFLDQRERTIIEPTAYREQVVGALVVTAAVLRSAAKRGFVEVPEKRFQKLQQRYLDEFDFLRGLSNTELYNLMVEAGAMRPIDKLITDQMGYVARMTNLRPGDPQFTADVAALIDANSGTNMQAMNRRAVEQFYTQREINGNVNTEMVWIIEGGPNTCRYCQDRAGQVQTYAEWVAIGLPGADTCAGGDRCRCHLAAL